jgi:hypothetical protein
VPQGHYLAFSINLLPVFFHVQHSKKFKKSKFVREFVHFLLNV